MEKVLTKALRGELPHLSVRSLIPCPVQPWDPCSLSPSHHCTTRFLLVGGDQKLHASHSPLTELKRQLPAALPAGPVHLKVRAVGSMEENWNGLSAGTMPSVPLLGAGMCEMQV